MKSVLKKSFYQLIFLMILFNSCKKAGTGGTNSLTVFPKHHSTPAAEAIVYIKYNTKKFPGEDVSVYDDSKIADTLGGENPHVKFDGLKKGNYYLYSVAYDSIHSTEVNGGLQVAIETKEGKTVVTVYLND